LPVNGWARGLFCYVFLENFDPTKVHFLTIIENCALPGQARGIVCGPVRDDSGQILLTRSQVWLLRLLCVFLPRVPLFATPLSCRFNLPSFFLALHDFFFFLPVLVFSFSVGCRSFYAQVVLPPRPAAGEQAFPYLSTPQ